MNEKIDLVSVIRRPDFHAALFTYAGNHYSFAGWWALDWSEPGDPDDGKFKEYATIDEFLNDPFFDGKTLAEAQDEFTDVDYELL